MAEQVAGGSSGGSESGVNHKRRRPSETDGSTTRKAPRTGASAASRKPNRDAGPMNDVSGLCGDPCSHLDTRPDEVDEGHDAPDVPGAASTAPFSEHSRDATFAGLSDESIQAECLGNLVDTIQDPTDHDRPHQMPDEHTVSSGKSPRLKRVLFVETAHTSPRSSVRSLSSTPPPTETQQSSSSRHSQNPETVPRRRTELSPPITLVSDTVVPRNDRITFTAFHLPGVTARVTTADDPTPRAMSLDTCVNFDSFVKKAVKLFMSPLRTQTVSGVLLSIQDRESLIKSAFYVERVNNDQYGQFLEALRSELYTSTWGAISVSARMDIDEDVLAFPANITCASSRTFSVRSSNK